jgi:beta-mannosidase
MSGFLSLNGTWQLGFAEGGTGLFWSQLTAPQVPGLHLLDARVPAPVHQVLLEAGLLEDPNIGLNSLRARWVEEMWWVYRRNFDVPAAALTERATLSFDLLDYEATIFLNGAEIGRHTNAFRPAAFDVTGKLKEKDNLLVVKIGAGLHGAADKPAAGYFNEACDPWVLTKRHWLRKPAYQSGWDWNPRLMSVGITGDVHLQWQRGPRLAQVSVFAIPTEDLEAATVVVRATVENAGDVPMSGTLHARIVETGGEFQAEFEAAPGESQQEIKLQITHPRLWWPAGHGEQFRYTVAITLESAGETQTVTRKVGVRRVELDQSSHPEGGRYFIIRINNRPIFCKGANWAPADLFYAAVPDERIRQLVALAAQAHFNIFRINGVGPYADHVLCEACDEAGIMLWHDFTFTCCQYPTTDPAFLAEVCREVVWNVRELACHPSLVLWCGNNEIEWFDCEMGFKDMNPAHPHYALFHMYLPRIVKAENPTALYWSSSPYSPDDLTANDPTAGDQHPWGAAMFNPEGPDWWLCRHYIDRFADEGGLVGASSPATLRQFLPENERYLFSPSWEHHDNPFATGALREGEPGRAYHMLSIWTGQDALAMQWEDYAFVSALLQAEALYEYIANYRRRMFSSAAAIFWSYNDSWPVTNGWTIVDYYLRRKLAYCPVKRAFAPVTVVVAEEGDEVCVFGVNDTPHPWSGEVRYGFFNLAGGLPVDQCTTVELAPNASTLLGKLPRAEWEKLDTKKSGAFAVLMQDGRLIAQHRLFVERFKDLAFATADIAIHLDNGQLTLTSDVFAWGVCLDVEGELPLADNCFDLLPGIPYSIAWPAALGKPRIVRIGSRDAVV